MLGHLAEPHGISTIVRGDVLVRFTKKFKIQSCGVFMQAERNALARAQQQLQVERSVNRKLLESKADVEYRLMEALSQHPAAACMELVPMEVPAAEPPGPRASIADLALAPQSTPRSMHDAHPSSGGGGGGSPQIPRLHLEHTQRHSEGGATARRHHPDTGSGPGGLPPPQPRLPASTGSVPASGMAPANRSGVPQAPGEYAADTACYSAVPPQAVGRARCSSSGYAGRGDAWSTKAAAAVAAAAPDCTAAASVTSPPAISRLRAPLQPLDGPGSGQASPTGSARTARSGALTVRHTGMRRAASRMGSERSEPLSEPRSEPRSEPPARSRALPDVGDASEEPFPSADEGSVHEYSGGVRRGEAHVGVADGASGPAGLMHAWTESCCGNDAYDESVDVALDGWEQKQVPDQLYEDDYEVGARGRIQRHAWRSGPVPLSGYDAVSAIADYTPRPQIPQARLGQGRGGIRGDSGGLPAGADEDRDAAAVQRERGGTAGSGTAAGAEDEDRRGRVEDEEDGTRLEQELRWSAVAGGSADLDGSAASAGLDPEVAGAMRHRLTLDLDDAGHTSGVSSSLKYLPYGIPVRGTASAVGVNFGQENENQNRTR